MRWPRFARHGSAIVSLPWIIDEKTSCTLSGADVCFCLKPTVVFGETQARAQAEQHISVLAAALQGLTLLEKGLRRRSTTCDLCAYSPDVVRYFLRTWPELETATTGVGSSGVSPIGGGSRDRLKLAAIKADLEAATDQALIDLLSWYVVVRIYKRQQRFAHYVELRRASVFTTHQSEPSFALAEARCIELISRTLGWYPHDICDN